MKFIKNEYLPSKRFIISFCIAVFIVIIGTAITYIKPGSTADKKISYENSTSSFSGNFDIPDWKTSAPSTSSVPLSALETVSRSLFNTVASEVQNNGQIDATKADNIAQDAIKNIQVKNVPSKSTSSDLNLIGVNNATLQADFATLKNVYLVETNAFKKIAGSDLPIINSLFSGKTPDKAALSNIVSQYQGIVHQLLKVPIPAQKQSILSTVILGIINNIEKIIFIDNDIIKNGKNGVAAYSDITNYYAVLDDTMTLLNTGDYIFSIQR